MGGRAVRYELHGLTAAELGADFDLVRVVNHGYLPAIYTSERPRRLLRARRALDQSTMKQGAELPDLPRARCPPAR